MGFCRSLWAPGFCSYSTLSVLFQDSCLVRTRAQVKFIIERYKSVPNLIAMDIK